MDHGDWDRHHNVLRRTRVVGYPRLRSSDPDLSGHIQGHNENSYGSASTLTRQDVTKVVRGEVTTQLSAFLACLDQRLQKIAPPNPGPDPMQIDQPEPSDEHKAIIASQEDRIKQLEVRVQAAEGEKWQANNERNISMQKLRASETKIKKLQGVILDSGLAPSGPNDEEIEKGFRGLRFDILQLVKRYCTNRSANVKNKGYLSLTPEVRDFWVMSRIATSLYRACFSDKELYFGFDVETDESLNKFYKGLISQKSVSQDDIAEWRIRTCLIGKARDSQLLHRRARAQDLANAIWKKLTPFMPSGWFQNNERNSRDVKDKLVAICESAYTMALTFNCSKTEYMWCHEPTRLDQVSAADVEVVGTAGHAKFEDAVVDEDYIVAFGSVVKGGGVQGKLAEQMVKLADMAVILGPFPD